MFKLTIPRATISDYWGVGPLNASVVFHARPSPPDLKAIFEHMGWSAPAKKDQMKKLDGQLIGGTFILSAKLSDEDKLKLKSKDGFVDTEAEIDLGFKTVGDFQVKRMEVEGKRGKGFRWELRFKITSDHRGFAAQIENYMALTDNAQGALIISYMENKQPEQQKLDGVTDDKQMALA